MYEKHIQINTTVQLSAGARAYIYKKISHGFQLLLAPAMCRTSFSQTMPCSTTQYPYLKVIFLLIVRYHERQVSLFYNVHIQSYACIDVHIHRCTHVYIDIFSNMPACSNIAGAASNTSKSNGLAHLATFDHSQPLVPRHPFVIQHSFVKQPCIVDLAYEKHGDVHLLPVTVVTVSQWTEITPTTHTWVLCSLTFNITH